MWPTLLLVAVTSLCPAYGQLTTANVLQCGNPFGGTCRIQCQAGELSVFQSFCGYYSAYYRVNFQRCVTSMPCCYWAGTCQTSCNSGQLQLTSQATCPTAGAVCCINGAGLATGTTTTTTATTATTTTATTTAATTTATTTAATTTTTQTGVATRQGVCGRSAAPTSRILGGALARNTWPWMARITYPTTSGFCAGVLVDDNTVLTAAHCVAGVAPSGMRVTLAEYQLTSLDPDEQTVAVREYFLGSGFVRGRRGNDLAVVKLSNTVTFTANRRPVCLSDPSIPLVIPQQCYIAGWGVSENGLDGRLREAQVNLLERPACEARLQAQGVPVTLPNDIVCTDNPSTATTDGCLFDDGDMLVCLDTRGRYSLVGLMSEYTCGGALPVLFTDVRQYTDVILNQLP